MPRTSRSLRQNVTVVAEITLQQEQRQHQNDEEEYDVGTMAQLIAVAARLIARGESIRLAYDQT